MTTIRQRLTAALDNFEQKLKESRGATILPDQRWRLPLLIDILTLVATSAPGEVDHAFRTPSRETTQNELSEIAERVSKLACRLRDPKCSVRRAREQLAQGFEDMHETTICALADTPAVMNHGEPALLNVAFVRCGLPSLLRDDSIDRERLANELEPLAQAAEMAEAPDSNDEGRWPDRRAQAVANILAHFYREATRLTPTISTKTGGADEGQHYGLFLDLIGLIFEAMNIEHDAYSFARRAADKIREEGEEKSTP